MIEKIHSEKLIIGSRRRVTILGKAAKSQREKCAIGCSQSPSSLTACRHGNVKSILSFKLRWSFLLGRLGLADLDSSLYVRGERGRDRQLEGGAQRDRERRGGDRRQGAKREEKRE